MGQKETPRKMENLQLVSPSQQCSSAQVGFGQVFISTEQYGNTGEPPHTLLALATADFYLLPRL
jgi:hypothetical protein